MFTFTIRTWIDNGVEAIKSDHKKWINQMQFGNGIGHSYMASITQYYSSQYKRKMREIQDFDHYHPCRVFLDEELAIKNNYGQQPRLNLGLKLELINMIQH